VRTIVALSLALALAAAGCGSATDERAQSDPGEIGERVSASELLSGERCIGTEERPAGNGRVAYALVAQGRTTAYARPGGRAIRTFAPMTSLGFPTVFGVLGVVTNEKCEPAWYRVQLPIRPNGATGYVRAEGLDLVRVTTRIEIDLSERSVMLLRNGRRVFHAVGAVGSSATPTPTGRYYVNQRIRVADPDGPYGPVVLGISGFSPVLTGWAEGGPIAIHGTNDPASVGKAVSNGCIRLHNATLVRLYDATPAGTPVLIRA
jgi:hypothetical protein